MKIIGHRGARGLAPENTLAAIEAGIRAGAAMVEVDVRVTRDGVPVLHHDPAFQGMEIDAHVGLRARQADLATLEDAIKLVNRRVPMVLEVKPGVRPDAVSEVVRGRLKDGWRPDDFFLASFDFPLLCQLHAALPEVATIVVESWSGVRAASRARRLNTPFICMNRRYMWWALADALRKRGFKLSLYTVNSPRQAERWERRGVYGVVTDFPDRLKGI